MSSPAAACWTKRVMPTTEACARCAEPKASQTNTPSQRSEEHTSELQSRLHLVCRLLLEKKNTILHDTGATENPTHLHDTTLGVSANLHSHYGSAGNDNGGGHTHTYPLSNLAKAGPAGGS